MRTEQVPPVLLFNKLGASGRNSRREDEILQGPAGYHLEQKPLGPLIEHWVAPAQRSVSASIAGKLLNQAIGQDMVLLRAFLGCDRLDSAAKAQPVALAPSAYEVQKQIRASHARISA